MKLLPLLSLAALLWAGAASGAFLDECPFDKDMHIDGVPVVQVLETFYKDLLFVQAATESLQPRQYLDTAREIERVSAGRAGRSAAARDAYEFLLQVLVDLQAGRLHEAEAAMERKRLEDTFEHGWPMTYYEYLQAEVYRLLGNHHDASSSLLAAFTERRESEGVAANDMERLDGLIALQKVSQFNQDVDMMYGLARSPDYQLLALVQLMVKGHVRPLNELRYTIIDRLYRTAPAIGVFEADNHTASGAAMDEGVARTEPLLDNFDAQSVAESAAERILCEFAQKLSILVAADSGGGGAAAGAPSDYADVMGQLRRLDPLFADKLDAKVVGLFGSDLDQAKENAHAMWSDIWVSSPPRHEVQVAFACYFCIELYRRSRDRCEPWMLNEMQDDSNAIRHMRKKRAGVSMDKIAELEARVVLVWFECFHLRLRSVYRLDGSEGEQQLAVKRALFGTGSGKIELLDGNA